MSTRTDANAQSPEQTAKEVDDLDLTADQAAQVNGGSEPTNDRKSPVLPPGTSLNHNETVV